MFGRNATRNKQLLGGSTGLLLFRLSQIVGDLDPILGFRATSEHPVETNCHFGGDSRAAIHNVRKLFVANTKLACCFRHAKA